MDGLLFPFRELDVLAGEDTCIAILFQRLDGTLVATEKECFKLRHIVGRPLLGKKNDNDLIWRDVYSQEGGKYTMTVAFISGENRNVAIHVNGKKAKTVTLNGDSWSNVAKKDVVIQLKKGVNTIRLSNTDGWMPDIDYIDLVCNNPQTGIKKKVAENNSYPGNNIVYNLDGRIDSSKNSAQRVVIKNHRKQLVK